MRSSLCIIALSAAVNSAYAQTTANSTALPTVDLGYNIQQASAYNASGDFYNFTNIRFAAPPTGNLRFAAPAAPKTDRSQVFNGGSLPIICPQSTPNWIINAEGFVTEYVGGQRNFSNISAVPTTPITLPTTPGTTEDCLFLDVFAPKTVFDNKDNCKKVPVLVWIYGGG